jgi:recombination protein RecA
LESLAIIGARDADTAARAANQLVRSGGFGLVVIDLGPKPAPGGLFEGSGKGGTEYASIPMPLQTRLVGLAQKNDTAVVVLTEKPTQAGSLGSLVSLRAEARRTSTGGGIELEVLKDKRRGPGQVHQETCRGPAGLC